LHNIALTLDEFSITYIVWHSFIHL
jgi:hypothetical protein